LTATRPESQDTDGFLPDALEQVPVPVVDPSFVSYLTIRQAMNALSRLQERYVVDQPASELQAYVCSMLRRADRPLRMGDIARFLCVEPQAITALVKRMEAKGLVQRVQSTDDRREVLLEVTEAGRELSLRALLLTQTVRRQAFATLSLEEHVQLAKVMITIRNLALKALGEDPLGADSVMRSVFAPAQIAPFLGSSRADQDEVPGE
jgi:DNA-binding MarR family transcriptional regulator